MFLGMNISNEANATRLTMAGKINKFLAKYDPNPSQRTLSTPLAKGFESNYLIDSKSLIFKSQSICRLI